LVITAQSPHRTSLKVRSTSPLRGGMNWRSFTPDSLKIAAVYTRLASDSPKSGVTYLDVHAVRLTVYDFGDTDLRDLDATSQARTAEKRISLSL
jgi:regulator of sirC expression with transglutaminase-like and TPR domain